MEKLHVWTKGRGCAVLAAACCAIFVAGCLNMEVDEAQARAHVRNYGWSLFGVIPLCSGNASVQNWSPWAFFTHDVSEEKLTAALEIAAGIRDRHLVHVKATDNGTCFFAIPQWHFALPIPYFICYEDIEVSADLVSDRTIHDVEYSRRLTEKVNRILEEMPQQ